MKRLNAVSAITIAVMLTGAGADRALAGPSACVSRGTHCYPTLAGALAAAHDGDRIRLDPGTFEGGVTIAKNVSLIGAGANATTIRGGGPVLTILGAAPTVTIAGLTVTGGVTSASGRCGPLCGTDYEQATALGGGIAIPGPATVTLRDSVVSGNRAAPATTVPSVRAKCPDLACRFALAGGGGIENRGDLTLIDTTVRDNEAGGPLASDADGAGIIGEAGSLTLRNSTVSGNRADASAPNGRFGEGGGLFVSGGTLTVLDSVVDGNRATLTSVFPSGVDLNAHAGGIHVGDGIPTRVERTAITGNTVTAADPFGEPIAFDSGMLVGSSPLVMRDSVVSGNRVTGTASTAANVGPGGSALELDGGGTITGTHISDNASSAVSANGIAAVSGALAVLNFDGDPKLVVVRDSVIKGNLAVASSATGEADVFGGGIFTNSLLELDGVSVRGNSGRALAPGGAAQGGGIWNGVLLSGPPVELALHDTTVTRNAVSGGPGVTLSGGGIFTTTPITLDATRIAHNAPDQCAGCAAAAMASARGH